MQAAQAGSRGAAISAGMLDPKSKTLFQEVLAENRLSLPQWVANKKKQGLDLSYHTAASWNKHPKNGGRPTPRLWAARIAKEFKRPALLLPENWRNGIKG